MCGLQDRGASQLVGRTKFVGADDSIILEDESARMKLRGEGLPVGQLVTGVVMAVKGVAAPGGDFQVNVSSASSKCMHTCLWVGGWHRCAVKHQTETQSECNLQTRLARCYVQCLYSFARWLVPSDKNGFC